MKKYIQLIKEQLYGIIFIILVIAICFLGIKRIFIEYGDYVFYGGILLVISGFIYSPLKLDKIKRGQSIIIWGVITMFLGYII